MMEKYTDITGFIHRRLSGATILVALLGITGCVSEDANTGTIPPHSNQSSISSSSSSSAGHTSPGNVAAHLTWTRPTQTEDGSPLTALAGFRIYYSDTPGVYANVIDLPDPTANSYSFTHQLSAGTWHFTVTAYDNANNESRAATGVSKTIQ